MGPDSKIQVGKTIPAFSVPALEDPSTAYTPDSFLGKIYLLDFWATWCGPCVGEQETLHKAYQKYEDQGFEILSFSMDGGPEDVRKFRKEKWPMPWLHTFVTGGFGSETAKTFELEGIPKPILVDRRGMIIATFEDLTGSSLDATLDRVFRQEK
jgi:thiol-disulfide isomerase/thioredoxin